MKFLKMMFAIAAITFAILGAMRKIPTNIASASTLLFLGLIMTITAKEHLYQGKKNKVVYFLVIAILDLALAAFIYFKFI